VASSCGRARSRRGGRIPRRGARPLRRAEGACVAGLMVARRAGQRHQHCGHAGDREPRRWSPPLPGTPGERTRSAVHVLLVPDEVVGEGVVGTPARRGRPGTRPDCGARTRDARRCRVASASGRSNRARRC
jgi:hypothetical protein